MPSYRRWSVILPLVLVLSACGVNLSGEPKILDEREIQSQPTVPQPTAAPTSEAATPESTAVDQPAQEDTGGELPGDYDLGQQLYVAECAACHGAQDGAGPSLGGMADRAATRVPGQSAADYLRESIVNPGEYLVEGYENIMPAGYGDQFSEHELDSLVKFIVEFVPPNVAAATQPTPAADSALPTLNTGETTTVRGRLIQGTEDGQPIPSDLPMELYVLDAHNAMAGIYDTTSAADGTFEFVDVARAAGNVYLIQANYDGVPQGAQIPSIEGNEEALSADVVLYEKTTDPSSVAVRWVQMLVNFAPINEFGLEIWLRLELANTGDRIVTTEQPSQTDWPVSVAVELPVGAFGIQPMQTEGSTRFQVDMQNGIPFVKDTWPLRPGQVHTITVAYYLPYTDGAVLEHAFGYPVLDGAVLMPNDTVTLESDQFDPEGEFRYRVMAGGARVTELAADERISPDTDFSLVKAHDLLMPLRADERLTFTLRGRPTRTLNVMTPANLAPDDGSTNPLPYVLGGIGLSVIVLAGVMWWRQRSVAAPVISDTWQPPDPSAGKDVLLRAIATLDDAYEDGHIDEDIYQYRRAILVERLVPLMDEDD
jgi:mono/diheme cytochrome c family protein